MTARRCEKAEKGHANLYVAGVTPPSEMWKQSQNLKKAKDAIKTYSRAPHAT